MTLEEMRKRISEDNETKDLKLSNSDILVVNRYLDLRGEVVDGYRVALKTDPYVEIVYLPTTEKLAEEARDKFKNHLLVFNSEVYLQDASLDDFKLLNEEREKVVKELKNFVENYKKSHYSKGYYISGKYGTGKTYLLSAVAHALVRKHINVLMVFMPDLVRSVRQGISDGNLEEKINQLKQVEVLMFDDIGGENMTPWFRDEVLLPVLQYRLSARLTTFFTSNLGSKELLNSLTTDKNQKIDFVKAHRVIQRITELAHYIKLDEEQYKV